MYYVLLCTTIYILMCTHKTNTTSQYFIFLYLIYNIFNFEGKQIIGPYLKTSSSVVIIMIMIGGAEFGCCFTTYVICCLLWLKSNTCNSIATLLVQDLLQKGTCLCKNKKKSPISYCTYLESCHKGWIDSYCLLWVVVAGMCGIIQ